MNKIDYCKIHNEPKNIITDRNGRECYYCYKEREEQEAYERNLKVCEKCGTDTSIKLIGDERYGLCPECGYITY